MYKRKWIDKQLPVCPFCHKAGPRWEVAREKRMDSDRYFFQCSGCGGTASFSTGTSMRTGIAERTIFTPATAKNALRIESVGGSHSKIEVGRYFLPDELQKLAEASLLH